MAAESRADWASPEELSPRGGQERPEGGRWALRAADRSTQGRGERSAAARSLLGGGRGRRQGVMQGKQRPVGLERQRDPGKAGEVQTGRIRLAGAGSGQ